MPKVTDRIQRAYREALEGGQTRVEYWFQHFGLADDPFGDPFERDVERLGEPMRWIVGIDDLAERLAKDVALAEKKYVGYVPIVGAPGAGRKTLCKVVASALHKDWEFREPADAPEAGRMNFLLGNTFKPANRGSPKGLEFVVLTNSQYVKAQQAIREFLVDEIWVKPRSSNDVASTLKVRVEDSLNPGVELQKILADDAIREICRYSMGLPGAALRLARESSVAAFWAKFDGISAQQVRTTARQLGLEAALKDYPDLSEPTRNVASILVQADRPVETGEVVEYYENLYGLARDRSVVSRHLNRLEALNLVERTERGRAASYQATPALAMAAEMEMYPR